jgi:hypothetical protein
MDISNLHPNRPFLKNNSGLNTHRRMECLPIQEDSQEYYTTTLNATLQQYSNIEYISQTPQDSQEKIDSSAGWLGHLYGHKAVENAITNSVSSRSVKTTKQNKYGEVSNKSIERVPVSNKSNERVPVFKRPITKKKSFVHKTKVFQPVLNKYSKNSKFVGHSRNGTVGTEHSRQFSTDQQLEQLREFTQQKLSMKKSQSKGPPKKTKIMSNMTNRSNTSKIFKRPMTNLNLNFMNHTESSAQKKSASMSRSKREDYEDMCKSQRTDRPVTTDPSLTRNQKNRKNVATSRQWKQGFNTNWNHDLNITKS